MEEGHPRASAASHSVREMSAGGASVVDGLNPDTGLGSGAHGSEDGRRGELGTDTDFRAVSRQFIEALEQQFVRSAEINGPSAAGHRVLVSMCELVGHMVQMLRARSRGSLAFEFLFYASVCDEERGRVALGSSQKLACATKFVQALLNGLQNPVLGPALASAGDVLRSAESQRDTLLEPNTAEERSNAPQFAVAPTNSAVPSYTVAGPFDEVTPETVVVRLTSLLSGSSTRTSWRQILTKLLGIVETRRPEDLPWRYPFCVSQGARVPDGFPSELKLSLAGRVVLSDSGSHRVLQQAAVFVARALGARYTQDVLQAMLLVPAIRDRADLRDVIVAAVPPESRAAAPAAPHNMAVPTPPDGDPARVNLSQPAAGPRVCVGTEPLGSWESSGAGIRPAGPAGMDPGAGVSPAAASTSSIAATGTATTGTDSVSTASASTPTDIADAATGGALSAATSAAATEASMEATGTAGGASGAAAQTASIAAARPRTARRGASRTLPRLAHAHSLTAIVEESPDGHTAAQVPVLSHADGPAGRASLSASVPPERASEVTPSVDGDAPTLRRGKRHGSPVTGVPRRLRTEHDAPQLSDIRELLQSCAPAGVEVARVLQSRLTELGIGKNMLASALTVGRPILPRVMTVFVSEVVRRAQAAVALVDWTTSTTTPLQRMASVTALKDTLAFPVWNELREAWVCVEVSCGVVRVYDPLHGDDLRDAIGPENLVVRCGRAFAP